MTRTAESQQDDIDWTLTTWDGARREQLRRWAALPLDRGLGSGRDAGARGLAREAIDCGLTCAPSQGRACGTEILKNCRAVCVVSRASWLAGLPTLSATACNT